MNSIHIREMKSIETPLLVAWLKAHKEVNRVDFTPFRKNQLQIFVAEDETGILCFIPVQYIYRYDALSPRPGIAPFRLAKVFQEMSKFLAEKAANENVATVIVEPNDEKFEKFLCEELGYEPVTRKTLKLKFGAKEKKNAN